MATEAQFNANRENAQKSTGARTPGGHYASSRNAVTYGLYTQSDFVLPEEAEIYNMFCVNMQGSCNAVDALEELLAAEITGAAWRLRRCNLVDGDIAQYSTLDPLLDATLEKQIRSIERARAASQNTFHRSINQLRKIQTERINRIEIDWAKCTFAQLADTAKAQRALIAQYRLDKETRELKDELASFCNSAPTQSSTIPQVGRNAACPCRSGKKFKRCCIGKAA